MKASRKARLGHISQNPKLIAKAEEFSSLGKYNNYKRENTTLFKDIWPDPIFLKD